MIALRTGATLKLPSSFKIAEESVVAAHHALLRALGVQTEEKDAEGKG